MTLSTRGHPFFCHAVIWLLTGAPMAAMADDSYETDARYGGLAVAIDRALPSSPHHKGRRLQEGWVQMSYVVTPDGHATDPIIVNSSGGSAFENEVRKVSESWRFEPTITGAELPLNVVNTRFTVIGRGKGATRIFARFARHIMRNLHEGRIAAARKEADAALERGGWNLYESTILWLMLGRVEGAEGDDVDKLEMYKRGLAVSNERSLRHKARIDLLEDIFQLEFQFGQYSAALKTLDTLREVPGSGAAVTRLTPYATKIQASLENEPRLLANAKVSNPCDCAAGIALWDYIPIRRIFSFANLNGNVERFEARCERQRLSAAVETDKHWILGADWGSCQIFVFGDDGATFDLVEHLPDGEDNKASDQTAMARNHVLDRRSRSQ